MRKEVKAKAKIDDISLQPPACLLGHPTARMTTGRTEKNKETIVWSVAVTDDMTIISGQYNFMSASPHS
jgi:hypothetical protein